MESTCVMQSGQEDGGLAALVPVPHPVQSEVPPQTRFLPLRPPESHQLLQNLLTTTTTRLPVDHLDLKQPVSRDRGAVYSENGGLQEMNKR